MRNTIIIGLIILVSCSKTDNDFEKYLGQLNSISTPTSFGSMTYPNKDTSDDYDAGLFEKFKSYSAFMVYGKMYEDEKTAGIIYTVIGDYNVPILMTYDKSGNKIDSLNLFENSSGFNFDSETFEFVTIYPDRRIQVIDSTKTWTMEDNGEDRIEGTEKVTVDTITYLIRTDGQIIKK
jgi:hypothetical protein